MGKKLTQGFVEEYISSFGYTLLSEYVNGRQHLQLQCPEGHTYNSSFENFRLNGTRCPACYRERVKAKDYLLEKLKSVIILVIAVLYSVVKSYK